MKKTKDKIVTIFVILVLLAGVGLLLYPTISDRINAMNQSRALGTYTKEVEEMSQEESDRLIEEAREYNRNIKKRQNICVPSQEELERYNNILNVTGNGIIGNLSIPKIKVDIPVYHGTGPAVLQVAAGHLEWTSFPVDGVGTHSVISGHTGLPSAKLFTDLHKLEEGDTFTIKVLKETYTYEVDQILIVLPSEIDDLMIDPKGDYCTLMTCTPYGVNSHRLLVRGRRIESEK